MRIGVKRPVARALRNVNGRREEIKGLQQDHRRLRRIGEKKRGRKGIYAVKEKCGQEERERSDEDGEVVFR